MPIIIMMEEAFFCNETPCCATASGKPGSASLTRFCGGLSGLVLACGVVKILL